MFIHETTDLAKTEEELVPHEEIAKGRENTEEHTWFVDNICPLVVGKDNYRRATHELIKEWMTVTLEAFALIVCKNFYKHAVSAARITLRRPEGTQQNRNKVEGAEPPLHTAGGKGAKRNQGWTKAGIDNYNENVTAVKSDREEHPTCNQAHMDIRQKNSDKENIKKRKKEQSTQERENGWKEAEEDEMSLGGAAEESRSSEGEERDKNENDSDEEESQTSPPWLGQTKKQRRIPPERPY